MTIAAIRQGLADALSTIGPLNASPTLGDIIAVPYAGVSLGDSVYDDDFDGDMTVNLVVQLLVSRLDAGRGQEEIDQYLEPSGDLSIYAAVMADNTLGGTCASAKCTQFTDYGTHPVGDVEYLGAYVHVEVLT